MKKFLIIIVFFLLIVFLIRTINENLNGYWICNKNNQWVKKGNPLHPKPVRSCQPIKLPKTKDDCLKIGGVWKKHGLTPFESCNRKAIDRGNLCRDQDECEGLCQVKLTDKQLRQKVNKPIFLNKKYGQCSVWVNEFGCQGIMEKGRIKIVCLD